MVNLGDVPRRRVTRRRRCLASSRDPSFTAKESTRHRVIRSQRARLRTAHIAPASSDHSGA